MQHYGLIPLSLSAHSQAPVPTNMEYEVQDGPVREGAGSIVRSLHYLHLPVEFAQKISSILRPQSTDTSIPT